MEKKLIIDIYSQINEADVGKELIVETGDIRCSETGEVYTGTFVLQDLRVVHQEELDENGT